MNKSGIIELIDLWYDWTNGRNFNIIQHQLGNILYDLEWNNGTSFFYTVDSDKTCSSAQLEVGILRPNWLDGGEYVGQKEVDGFLCNVWTKAEFITYYEDVVTKRPVSWVFYTGREAHVMTFEVGAALEDAKWQVPWYCFEETNNATATMPDDAAYLQTQLLIAQKEEARIQLQAEEYDLMAAAADLDETEEVNTNCILMANLQQASTSGTQTDSAPVYDTDGSVEVHENCDDNEIFNMFTQEEQYTELLEPILELHQTDSAPIYDTDGSAEVHENCDDNEIFNMFTQEEQYTELLEPIPESHQVPQNDNDVISEDTSVEQGEETVEQHPANFEETRALYESLYLNLAIKVEKFNSVNRKLKETNADLTTKLARYKIQERCFEISQEKYDKLERIRYPVDTSLIHIESRKSPTAVIFDVDTRRISIVTVNAKEYHSDVLARSQG
nr:glycosyl transferase [Tanacetum cinerariifolium]